MLVNCIITLLLLSSGNYTCGNATVFSMNLSAFFSVLLLLVYPFGETMDAQSQKRDYYAEGMIYYQSGNVPKALEIWYEGYKETSSYEDIDPRIGSAFVEAAVQARIKSVYTSATLIYYWSLNSKGKGDYEEYLLDEVRKAAPVFEEFTFEDILKKGEGNPFKAAGVVKSYWKSLDPTPDTEINERLIEHFERIQYVKKNFTRNRSTVFGTDERALTYLRYGRPDFIDSGTLEVDEQFIRSYLGQIGLSGINSRDKVDYLISKSYDAVREVEYEVWVYKGVARNGKIVKIFGKSSRNGEYGELDSVGEFVPNSAFSVSDGVEVSRSLFDEVGQKKIITPGLLITLSFYDQFFMYDSQFSDAFQTIDAGVQDITTSFVGREWVSAKNDFVARSMDLVEQSGPVEKSEYLDELARLRVDATQYLFYTPDNSPYYISVMNSYPQEELLKIIVGEEREEVDGLWINHTMSLVSYGGEEADPVTHEPDVPFLNDGMTHPAQSIFKVPMLPEDGMLKFSVQLYDDDAPDSGGDALIPESLRGRGGISYEQGGPVDVPDDFALSDIMIGYQTDSSDWDHEIPFVVSLDGGIPDFSNLFMHFQAVNLEKDRSGNAQLEVEFYVERRGQLFNRDSRNIISATLHDPATQIEQSLEVDLADREPGKYRLVVKFTDSVQNKSIEKEIPFEIINTGLSPSATIDQ